MISANLLNYLVEFLLGETYIESEQGVRRPYNPIVYTDKPEQMRDASIVIKASPFFRTKVYGTEEANPRLPLAEWQGVPLLFGEARHEWINEGETLVIHADIIASTFYLISRYEEMTKRHERDAMGRFPGKQSLPYRAGFLHRPIVDEYGTALQKLLVEQGILEHLGLNHRPRRAGFSRITLSHDIYRPFGQTGFKGLVSKLLGKSDPYNCFAELLAEDERLAQHYPKGKVQTRLFLKSGCQHERDKPHYFVGGIKMYQILQIAEGMGAKFGLLCSYASSSNPHLIPEEMKALRSALGRVYRRIYRWEDLQKQRRSHHSGSPLTSLGDLELISSRHAYFALGEPEDTREILAAGIRHDYSMAYADVGGFRLGTCRPVRFINPNTRSLTDLTMHPPSLVGHILATPEGMHLDEETAYNYALKIIEYIHREGGELNLVWRNEDFAPELHPWLGKLYIRLLNALIDMPG